MVEKRGTEWICTSVLLLVIQHLLNISTWRSHRLLNSINPKLYYFISSNFFSLKLCQGKWINSHLELILQGLLSTWEVPDHDVLKKKKKNRLRIYPYRLWLKQLSLFHYTAKFQNIDFLKNWLHIFHLFMHITLKSKENLHSFIIDKIENKKLGSQLTLLTVKLYTQFNRRALA